MYSVISESNNLFVGLHENPPENHGGFYFVDKTPSGFDEQEGKKLDIYYDKGKGEFYAVYSDIPKEETQAASDLTELNKKIEELERLTDIMLGVDDIG